ncbi:MAG: glycosyltransferase family 4 protein [Armatimonadota bacterium]
MARPGLRIAFYDAYASLEGSGMALCEIVRHLDRERFEPIALLPRAGPLADALQAEGCPAETMVPEPPLDAYGRRLLTAAVGQKLRAGRSLRRHWCNVAEWLRAHQVRVLHCNQTRAALQAGPAGRLAGVPVVWNVRIREALPWSLLLLVACSADRIVPLTHDWLAAGLGAPWLARRCVVIPNAVDLERFHPGRDGLRVREELGVSPAAPLLLSVGALVPRKGFDLLIAALPTILAAHPGARLAIAGGPPSAGGTDCAAELRAQAQALGVDHAVLLLGRREDVPELLAACDLFVLASRREGQPGAVLEAMAAGRAVVVTPAAAAGVTAGRTGVVVPPDDPAALAAGVLDVLGDRAWASELGAAARAHVARHHDVRAMVRAYERVYLEVLGEAG